MTEANSQRVLVELIKEIAADQRYGLTCFSHDWILRLEKNGATRHIFGYNFEINSATAELLAGDKAAIADLLAHQGIANVPHRLFLHPRLSGYVSAKGNWPAMLASAEEFGYPLVCKPNAGTGGLGVTLVNNVAELELAVYTLFQKHRGISFSPYLEIDQEFRAIMLDGELQLLYTKRRPHVVGDGQASLMQLIQAAQAGGQLSAEAAGQAIENKQNDLQTVPAVGEEVLLGWKHNLGAGSSPQQLGDGPLASQLSRLARQAQQAINIRFASVDIVEVQGEHRVLEINSGVMMEHFVRSQPEHRATAKAIYARAIERMFGA
ncbi:MAG: hypothetical protein KIS80_00170 [Anaerolineales bacterium]|nr:hypothetical protein [Anaerolineales bacterium]